MNNASVMRKFDGMIIRWFIQTPGDGFVLYNNSLIHKVFLMV